MSSNYQICTKTVMDTSDPDIIFDESGICNHYHNYHKNKDAFLLTGDIVRQKIDDTVNAIKAAGKGSKYDCILGLSGGVDSTYLCLLAKRWGLNPLVVHFDNGWNSELAVMNIENTISRLGFDLFTYVVDWDEFRELQRSYFYANVIDIEVLTDHGFMSVLLKQAVKHKIQYVLDGLNYVTESILAPSWSYDKSDLENIYGIQRAHGSRPLKTLKSYPFCSKDRKLFMDRVLKLKKVSFLNWVDYHYEDVKEILKTELGWRDYGGKHYESIFTRFYQGYILPRKFKIDKRRAHLSTMICSGQMSRDKALEILEKPSLSPDQAETDKEFALKKLGFSEAEFEAYINAPPVPHLEYGTSQTLFERYPLLKVGLPIIKKFLPSHGGNVG